MIVEDVRLPFPGHPGHDARLDLIDHVAVTIVVVPYVLLIEERGRRDLVRRTDVGVIPIGDHRLAVRVDAEPEQEDDLVENRGDLGIRIGGYQIVGELDRVLRVSDLRGMEAPVYVNDRPSFGGELFRFIVGEVVWVSELLGDFAVVLQISQVVRRRDDRQIPGTPVTRASHLEQLNSFGGIGQESEVFERFFVSGELEVGTDLVPQSGCGVRDRLGLDGPWGQRPSESAGKDDGGGAGESHVLCYARNGF